MTEGQAVVIALRLLVPLLILRRPLAGGLAAVALDALDVVLVEQISEGGFGDHYNEVDKALDLYYLALAALVAWRWTNPWARWPAVLLFLHRLAGTTAFELTGNEVFLFVFPNLFEHWWFYCLIVPRFWPRLEPSSWRSIAIPLVLLLLPKLAQEYVLHVQEAQPWDWFKRNVLDET